MRKSVFLAVVLFLATGIGAFAEIELGIGIAPPIGEVPEDAASDGLFGDATTVLHAGYSFWWLFYASYDAFVLPPYAVSQMTGTIDPANGGLQPGYYRPGYLNTFNFGIRPRLGPLMLTASIGANSLYIYKGEEDGLEPPPLGVNLRFGAGWKISKHFGLMATGTTVFGSMDELSNTLDALNSDNPDVSAAAEDRILANLFPSIVFSLYF